MVEKSDGDGAIEVPDDKANVFVFYSIEHRRHTVNPDNDLGRWVLDRVASSSEADVLNDYHSAIAATKDKGKKDNWYRRPEKPKIEFPVYHLYGRTYDGRSILCVVHGFYTYFYLKIKEEYRNALVDDAIAKDVRQEIRRVAGSLNVRSIVFEEKFDTRGFHEKKAVFARITLNYNFKETVRRVSERFREQKASLRYVSGDYTYVTDADPIVQFLADQDLPACSWVEYQPCNTIFPKSKEREENYGQDTAIDTRPGRKGRCDVEIHCHYSDLKRRTDIIDTGRAISLSVDIELLNFRGEFNDCYDYKICSISLFLTREGQAEPVEEVVLALGNSVHSRSQQSNALVIRSFSKEEHLLMAFCKYILDKDPDVIEGYNIYLFDLDYIFNRAKQINVPQSFYYMGRLLYTGTFDVRDTTFRSKNSGTIESKKITMAGRVIFDVLPAVKQAKKLRSYKLDSVAYDCLKENKEDVDYSEIPYLWASEGEDARRLHTYCMQDSRLARRLNCKLLFFVNFVEMSRVCFVPLNYLLERGQQVKIIAQLYAMCNKIGYVMYSEGQGEFNEEESREKKFEGATVIDPKRGFYHKGIPVPTLDFSSLYPSIIIAYNMCYTTYLPTPEDVAMAKARGWPVVQTPRGDYFIHKSVRKGLLPLLLENLLKSRGIMKKKMNEAKDPLLKAVYNGAQLAVKLCANSIYGFTGAQKLPAFYISASVTAYGREGIMLTKRKIEEKWKGVKIIYGDTDSVMVAMYCAKDWPMQRTIDVAKEMANYVNQFFEKPMNLEFEKIFCPYLLLEKKKYAGLHWESADKPKMLNIKGIEPVRRDNAPIIAETVQEVLNILMYQGDVNIAARYVVKQMEDVRLGRVPIDKLVISKNYSKSKERYAAPQPHLVVIDKMISRNPGSEPTIGSRVPYVMVQSPYEKTCMRAEDPEYVRKNPTKVKIDNVYYHAYMQKALERVLSPIFGDGNMQRLFTANADSINQYTIDSSLIGQSTFTAPDTQDTSEQYMDIEASQPSFQSQSQVERKKRNLDTLGDDIVSSKRTQPSSSSSSSNRKRTFNQTSLSSLWK